MKYRYLETTGVLNEASSDTAWRERSPSARLRAQRAGKKNPVWRGKPIPLAICDLVPESLARENLIFPVGEDGETLTVAAVDHDDVALADKISFVLSRPVRLIAASREEVEALIREYFGDGSGSEAVDSMLQEFTDEAASASPTSHHPGLASRCVSCLPKPCGHESSPRSAARRGVPGRRLPIRSRSHLSRGRFRRVVLRR